MPMEEEGMPRRRRASLVSTLRMRDFRRLWTADMISLLGDWSGRLALTVLVLERTGSPGWAASVTAVSLAGFVGIGQLLATLGDRFGRVSVMIAADIARAALFLAMLVHMPVGAMLLLAFLAGLATPPFEAARSAALVDIVPEHRYGDALALSGVSIQGSVVAGNALGGGLLVLVGARGALTVNALSFLVSAVLIYQLRHTPASSPAGEHRSVAGSLRAGAGNLFGDRMVRRAILLISVTGALGTVAEALVVPYASEMGLSRGLVGVLAASVAVGTIAGTLLIARSSDHHALLRSAGLCTVLASGAALPLFWFEVRGLGVFAGFAIAGGIFAVSIPTNIVIGTRLLRETRASAMGIAVGVLMGSQALGAAVGGVAASVFSPSRAIAGALVLAATYGAWSVVTTPVEAKHLAGRRRVIGEPTRSEPDVVIDLDEQVQVLDLDARGSRKRPPKRTSASVS
ncbi:MAG: MFS transporter [Acidimicrobiales bacterium]